MRGPDLLFVPAPDAAVRQTDPGRGIDAAMPWDFSEESVKRKARAYIEENVEDPQEILEMLGLNDGAPKW